MLAALLLLFAMAAAPTAAPTAHGMHGREWRGELGLSSSVRVVSYNVLAPCLVGHHSAYVAPAYLEKEHRYPLILADIQEMDADLVGLQEVEHTAFTHDFCPALKALGYTGRYYRPRGNPIGVAVFWKTASWRLSQRPHEISFAAAARSKAFRRRVQQQQQQGGSGDGAAGNATATAAVATDGATGGAAALAAELGDGMAVVAGGGSGDSSGSGGSSPLDGVWKQLAGLPHGAIAVVLERTTGSGDHQHLVFASAHLFWDPRQPHMKTLQSAALGYGLHDIASSHRPAPPRSPLTRSPSADSADSTGSTASSRSGEEDGDAGGGGGGEGSPACDASTAPVLSGGACGRVIGEIAGSEAGAGEEAAAPAATAAAPLPIILTGDFNSVPLVRGPDAFDPHLTEGETMPSGVYQLLTTGRLPPGHAHHPSGRLHGTDAALPPGALGTLTLPVTFASSYAAVAGADPAWTNWTATFKACLDYILTSVPAASGGVWARPAAVLATPPDDVVAAQPDYGGKGVLGTRIGSDHVPLAAELVLEAHA